MTDDTTTDEPSTEELSFDRIALTGTPGTGKSTVADAVGDRLGIEIIHLNDRIKEYGLHTGEDEERGSLVADIEAIEEHLGDWSGLLDSHLSHQFEADAGVVLRCAPEELEERLTERGETAAKAVENAESEALDIVLSEAVRRHGEENIYEIDTSDRAVEAVTDDVIAVLRGEREPAAGIVDFTGSL